MMQNHCCYPGCTEDVFIACDTCRDYRCHVHAEGNCGASGQNLEKNVNRPSKSKQETIQITSQSTIEQVGQWIETLSREKGIGNSEALKQRLIENEIDGETLLKLDRDFIERRLQRFGGRIRYIYAGRLFRIL
jgi:phosphopentomutase